MKIKRILSIPLIVAILTLFSVLIFIRVPGLINSMDANSKYILGFFIIVITISSFIATRKNNITLENEYLIIKEPNHISHFNLEEIDEIKYTKHKLTIKMNKSSYVFDLKGYYRVKVEELIKQIQKNL